MSQAIVKKTSDYFKSKGVVLPSISELQDPQIINDDIKNSLKKINNNDINPLNLFRVHWFNKSCLLYTSPSPRDRSSSRMPSSA